MELTQMVRSVFLFALVVVCSHSFAQTRYACRLADGRTVASDRPCASGQNLTYYGPQTDRPNYGGSGYSARQSGAPEYLKYMSPTCSSMHDAIRTSNARGVKAEAAEDARRNYSIECAANESEASRRLSTERRDKIQAGQEAQRAEESNQRDAAVKAQQCGESKRILVAKRARTDLTEGEKGDLKRFEDTYKARCAG